MSNKLTTLAVALFASVLFTSNASALPVNKDSLMIQGLATTKPVVKKEAPKKITEEKVEPVKPAEPIVVVHEVVEGDTLSDIATKYNTNWTRIWSKNTDLENQDVLKVGQKLTIPNSDEQLAERATIQPVTAVAAPTSDSSSNVVYNTTSAPAAPQRGSGGPNGYGYGWCTWWVKEKRPDIGGYWGNGGYNWLSAAQAAGFETGSVARAGAIGVMAGHVVYVESVSGDTVNISEMGWNYTQGSLNYRSVPASSFQYIY